MKRDPTAGRANGLDGAAWTRNSISVWSDIRKSGEETALKHPAMFPAALPARLIDCFTAPGPGIVLDPFLGIGSTAVAALSAGKKVIGFELSPEFFAIAQSRVNALPDFEPSHAQLIHLSALRIGEFVEPGSVDLCVTSPPYWDILKQRRSADLRDARHYGDHPDDLGSIGEYDQFLARLNQVFEQVLQALRPGGYCCVVVMDIRKGKRFYPFHSDLAARLASIGFEYDDLIIWDRRLDYNRLRPLGYPAVFRINKVHEFILVFQKPRQSARPERPLRKSGHTGSSSDDTTDAANPSPES